MIFLYLLIMETIFLFGAFCDRFYQDSMFMKIWGAVTLIYLVAVIFNFDKLYTAAYKDISKSIIEDEEE